MTMLIPRPLRDYYNLFEINQICRKIKETKADSDQTNYHYWCEALGTKHNKDITEPYSRAIKTTLRISLAVASVLLSDSSQLSTDANLAGFTLSIPSMSLISGSQLIYNGSSQVVNSIAANSLKDFGLGLAAIATGWLLLESYDLVPLGIAESIIIEPFANSFAPRLQNYIAL